jgi:hypothetical protein
MTLVNEPLPDRLLRGSARQSYDPDVDIDWSAPPVEGLWWMQPERVSLYGTALWDRLSEEQQITLSQHEIGSIASVGAWFEIVLMRLLLREVYHRDPREAWAHYALTEVGDETRHVVMFGRALASLGVPAYGPRPQARTIARLTQPLIRDAGFYSVVLIGEEPVDRLQRALMRDERIQPMVRMVSRIHVLEEARHVSFAREELARAARSLGRTRRAYQQLVTAQAAYVMMRSLVNPEAYRAVGIDPAEGRRTALGNEHYRQTIRWMGEKMMPFLEEHGMVGRAHLKTWRASFLVS